ncbi:MAG: amino acid permease [Tetragenococcus halophilus]|uniref:Amino acid transport protein n=1 Tax=Tetragenococcus halophilus TaxID=51669 RepID=F1SZK7_TETHA|nr:amino acid permease [Tetragenococcus halophilus]MDN6243945.1 amino acid permease [Tetragenococcus koreensis]MDN6141730.1 amino acid permease [Tetragenococcus halophilus]MDN6143568.1 amino acid permease [Tetragenococcus halophilus]MDN6153380.1 amino acid permease [Tetragenococcus halophilus]MDN6255449.1 amino acid permease [Tetragenococcus koreensis]
MEDGKDLSRSLRSRHIQMIAIGGAIGTGLFLGSGTAIHESGPSIILAYTITGIFCFFLMRSIGELLLSDIRLHSFIDFIKRYMGNKFEFITGWTYWLCWINIAMADLTASGIYVRFWFPKFPQWATPLIIIIVLLITNTASVKIFGEMESWFAFIKVIAILALIGIGGYLILIGYHGGGTKASLNNLVNFGGFFPTGIRGFLISFQMVLFAFAGIEMVGITAGETENPKLNLPKAINSLPVRIGLFYVGSMIIIMSIYPWNALVSSQSPFVTVFNDVGIQQAAGIINFVVLTAALSACNSAIFSTSRTLFALAKGGNAPKIFKKLGHNLVPNVALNFSSMVLLIVVVLNYFVPDDVFKLISGMATINFIFVWIVLIVCHIIYRRTRKEKSFFFQMPGYPFTDYLTILFFVSVLVILMFDKSLFFSLLVSIIWFVLLLIIYKSKKKRRQNYGKSRE